MKKDRGILFGGKGPEPDGRQKTGVARFLELMDRDFAKFFVTGLPALAAGTLYGFAVWCGLVGKSILITLGGGLAAGLILGPAVSGVTDTILRALRDEPGFWQETYKKAWKQNAAQSCLTGGILGLILAGLIFSLCLGGHPLLTLVSMVILISVYLYVFPQIVLMDLKTADLFRNALTLILLNPGTAALSLLIAALWAGLIWLLLPLSALIWAAGGVWFPALLILMCQEKVLRQNFLERDGKITEE